MTVPLNEIGRTGRLEMVFASKRGKTILQDAYCEIPFKITRLYHPPKSSMAQLILMSPTAGIFGGDRLRLKIHVQRGASIWITSQGSPKLHPSQGRIAHQQVDIHVEAGGELHFTTDPLIPFADSALQQQWQIHVEPGACFSCWDGFTAGRVFRGERWQFQELSNEMRVWEKQKLLYLDRYSLHPVPHKMEHPFLMSHFDYFASILAYGEPLQESILEPWHASMAFDSSNSDSDATTAKGELFSLGAVGLDVPNPSFLTGRLLAQDGALFKRKFATFYKCLFQALHETLPPSLRKL